MKDHIKQKISDSNIFYVSVSQLIAFHQCPARYSFTRKMASLKPPSWFIQDGIIGHALMAGKEESLDKITPRAVRLSERVKEYIEKNYKIHGVEIEQNIVLSRNINLLRTIDALGEDKDGGILLDYKFVGSQWDVIPELNLAPKAAGFQSKAYLISPESSDPYDVWPSRMHYVVVSDNDLVVYKYETRSTDFKDVLDAAKNMKVAWDRQRLPRNESYACHSYCDFRAPCFDEKDWEVDYREVDNDPYRPDIRYRDRDEEDS